ncbi:hypothetical protein Tco_0791079 [Tanacetum coccineum]
MEARCVNLELKYQNQALKEGQHAKFKAQLQEKGVIHKTNVSRPQLRSTQMKDKVVPNNSQVKDKKTEVEDHPRISSISRISNKTKSVTASNDSLKSKTLNVTDIVQLILVTPPFLQIAAEANLGYYFKDRIAIFRLPEPVNFSYARNVVHRDIGKASDYDNSSPVPQLQNVSPSADTTVPSQQELDLLFGPLYDEFFTAGTSSVNNSSSPIDNSKQQDTPPTNNIQSSTEPTTPTNVNANGESMTLNSVIIEIASSDSLSCVLFSKSTILKNVFELIQIVSVLNFKLL